WTEREHTRQWDNTSYWQDHGWDYCGTDPAQADGEIYTETTCARIIAVIDGLLDLYFPYGRPNYSLFGDCNKDGRVDFKDLAALALYWSQTNCGHCGGADLTGDGQVDFRDVNSIANYWLTATTIPPLPEPASRPGLEPHRTMFTSARAVHRRSSRTRPLQHLTPARCFSLLRTTGVSIRSMAGVKPKVKSGASRPQGQGRAK
ncbi:MAG: dockerin type I domain-containing protein, partial [Planctomycetota bacterium]